MTATLSPLTFAEDGPLLGAPLEQVDNISVITGTKRGAGPNYFGVASDLILPGYSATANLAPFQLIGTSATLASNAVAGGSFRIGSAATDEAVGVLKLNGGAFLYSTTKPMWFACRVAMDNLATGEFLAGLCLNSYAATALSTLPTDGLFFAKTEAGTDLSFQARNGGTSTSLSNICATAGVTLTADTMLELAFRVTDGSVYAFVNSRLVGSIARGDANLPVDAADLLTLFIGRQAEGANVRYVDVDYFLAAAQR